MTQEQLRMQMLAGIITESQYKAKLNEANEEQQKTSQQKDIASIDKKEFFIGSAYGFDVYELPKGRKDLYDVALELNIIPGHGWVHPTDTGMRSYFDQYIEKGPLFIFSKPGSKEKYIFSYEKKQFQNKNGEFINEEYNESLQYFNEKTKIIDGIKLFINDMFNFNIDSKDVSYEFADNLFNLMCTDKYIKNDSLFNIFLHDNYYVRDNIKKIYRK
jgi:hypothetical protein